MHWNRGGGGGSAGDTALEYKITLRADKSSLPVNIGNQGPGIGTFAPYTTVLHVMATEGGNPIVGTKDAFACNVEQDLKVGALYYLDGKSEHETDVDGVKIPNAYRNITLDSNSGGSSFHFHAGNTTGNACTGTAACAAHDERTGTGNRRHERILHWIRMPFFSFARPLRGGRRP